MRRVLAALGAALTATALVTACNTGHEQGPAGQVIAKDTDRDCVTTGTGTRRSQSCTTEYELTTRDKQGVVHEFEVPEVVYDNCRRGSAYPGCTDR